MTRPCPDISLHTFRTQEYEYLRLCLCGGHVRVSCIVTYLAMVTFLYSKESRQNCDSGYSGRGLYALSSPPPLLVGRVPSLYGCRVLLYLLYLSYLVCVFTEIVRGQELHERYFFFLRIILGFASAMKWCYGQRWQRRRHMLFITTMGPSVPCSQLGHFLAIQT